MQIRQSLPCRIRCGRLKPLSLQSLHDVRQGAARIAGDDGERKCSGLSLRRGSAGCSTSRLVPVVRAWRPLSITWWPLMSYDGPCARNRAWSMDWRSSPKYCKARMTWLAYTYVQHRPLSTTSVCGCQPTFGYVPVTPAHRRLRCTACRPAGVPVPVARGQAGWFPGAYRRHALGFEACSRPAARGGGLRQLVVDRATTWHASSDEVLSRLRGVHIPSSIIQCRSVSTEWLKPW